MPNPRPKTNAQVRRMFGLAKEKADLARMRSDDYLRNVVVVETGARTGSISDLTFDEANKVIVKLGGDPFSARGNSARMQNYRKQAAGIQTIETDNHVAFIRKQAAKRNMSEDGIASLAARMNLPWPTLTTKQGNKLAEALKAMNKRDEQGTQAPLPAAEPTFRRVA